MEKTKNVDKKEITSELKDSYLDYAMSVIVSRALPDVRDGLKPVHRRILWAMWESGLTHLARFRKSANVVGETMARYHPHGDIAIYDTLVRMAQDFSLRYPLVSGQGNFGCFTADTKVLLTDGRELPFRELVKEYRGGKKNYTYTINTLGLISVSQIQHPRRTRKNAKLVKVVLDNAEEIRCTPDHLFMLLDGSYKKAKDLLPEDPLMPLYQKISEKADRINRKGYLLVHQNKTNEWVPAHHLADNYNLTHHAYGKSAGRVRHHIDFNKLNNNPDNIRRVGWGEHWRIHYVHASRQHQNPAYRQKIAEGRNKYWADPAERDRRAKMISRINRENWQKSEYREKMRRFLSAVNKQYIKEHPEKRKELSLRFTKTLKRLWQDPSYRAKMHEHILKGNKSHTTNHTGKLKFLNVCKETVRRYGALREEVYAEVRKELYPYGAAPLWETALGKYFQNNPDLVRREINRNHRVVKVEDINEREDVYDLTVDGSHNFALASGVFVHNSIDGDSPAAMRYSEVKLSRVAEELLVDIEKDTVDWQPNYDGTREEPKVLPAKLPNLLLGGSVGIAVGMTTNIPPHNLTEIADAIFFLADNPNAGNDELMEFVKGPDFPTGGIIFDRRAISQAYASGRGSITMRGRAEVAERKSRESRGGFDIVITEIPYQVNKAELITKVAALVQEKRIDGIRDIRDESDKDGLRVVLELKGDAPPQKILNQLYQHTDLQKDFHVNMLALAGGIQPQILSLRDILTAYLGYRRDVVKRRTQFDLKKAEDRAHILLGLVKALEEIDRVIATIKKSKDRDDAHGKLIKAFSLSDLQATAILEMKLQTLAALEREKIEAELKEKAALIKELQLIVKSPARILGVIKAEIKELKEKYGDPRRTQVIAGGLKEFKDEDLIPEEEVIITLSAGGYVKRLPPDAFRSQRRGGKGLIGSELSEEDFITHFIDAKTHDSLLFFTDRGRVVETKTYEVPPASRTSKGKAIHNVLELPVDERVSALVPYRPAQPKDQGGKHPRYLVMATRQGLIKKTPIEDFKNIRRSGIIAIALKKNDLLKNVHLSTGHDEIVLTTRQGQAIRFKESNIRSMGRSAAGVRAIRLKGGDEVAGFDIMRRAEKAAEKSVMLLTVMEHGFAKQTPLSEYKVQNRGGSGVKTANITAKTGPIIASKIIGDEKEIFALSAKGQIIRTSLQGVRKTGRAAQGVKIMNLRSGDRLAGTVIM